MFNTSGDILDITLAVCVVVLTVFICLGLYYLVSGIHKIHKVIKRVDDGVSKAEEIIEIAREKLKNSSAYFMILGEIAKKAMEFVQEKREKKNPGTKKKK
ncbi:hypothetical protein AUJ26_02620 [Candidatus Falkowbacteria bacterium CG1_02_37_21]|nr:MAG: hypothetical protein AUJ26_02620 [Candidatus Falkowbacteria bacterium CG1_02_37_21]